MILRRFRRVALLLATWVLLSPGISGASEGPPPSWRAAVASELRAAEYRFGRQADGSFSAPNRVQGLRSFVEDQVSLRVEPRDPSADRWELRLRLSGIGRGADLLAPGPFRVSADHDRAERTGELLTEWFVNSPTGIEHGLTISTPPPGGSRELPLVVELQVEGDLAARLAGDRQGLGFDTRDGRRVLRYDSLEVEDARGDRLGAHFEYSRDRLRIVVEDRGAVYPVVIDPLVTVPDWFDTIGQADARLGISIAGAGDLDADGYEDVLVGAEKYDNGEPDEGRVFVYLGTPGGPDTSPTWTAESNHSGARFGTSVAGAGDVNGDGFDDVVIGAPRWDDGSQTDEGGVFVYYGSPNALNPLLLRPEGTPQNADWHAEGNQATAEFGFSVAGAGDVNNDGTDDIVVGAWLYFGGQTGEGSAYVFHGSDPDGLALPGGTRPVGGPANADWHGESNEVAAAYGYSVAGGDISGDGINDIIVGAPDYQTNFFGEGRVYAYKGSAGGVSLTPVWTRDGGVDGASFGASVAAAGDVDGDNLDDVIVGADAFTNGQVYEGAAFLFRGKVGGALGGTPDWTAEFNQGSAAVGSEVAYAGDVNNDGYSDALVAAVDFDDGEIDEGAVFLFYGGPDGLAAEPAAVFEIDQSGSEFGQSLGGADVNGDGFDDILIGANRYTLTLSQEGGAFIYFGCQDADRDGICQAVDNCPALNNPDQADTDGDGLGDICDPCEDQDGDTVCDSPQVLVDWAGPGEEVLVQYGSPMRFLANTFISPGPGIFWTPASYDDSLPPWQSGLYGVGYEDPPAGAPVGCSDLLVSTNPPVPGTVSIYTRAEFVIPAGTDVQTLHLGVEYDDAFVAWINGVEVYRSGGMPSGTPAWNTVPTQTHESSNAATPVYNPLHDISLTGIPALNIGNTNVLAIGVWNAGSGSSDLVLVPRLSINRAKESKVRYLANSADDLLGATWRATSFNDEAWSAGNYGVGFDTAGAADELVNTEVPSTARSIYTRTKFPISLGTVQNMFLRLDYDDGVVAWINGQEVYRTPSMPGAPGTTPAWNASPTPHESSNAAEPDYGTPVDISNAAIPYLGEGDNLLAVAVYNNSSVPLDDLVVVPRLSINEAQIDNCPGVANPSQSDVDSDGLGDACDPDIDNDGILNGPDNCPSIPNFVQTDSDTDGAGDPCDPCPDDAANDVDNDGYCAGTGFLAPKIGDHDNCPTVANPTQADQNSDGEGDACDPDIDGDGVLNGSDNCVTTPNPSQTNGDGDAYGAACDCNDADISVWAAPAAVSDLRIAKADVCVDFTCTETLGQCGNDTDCLADRCENFACTQTLAACDTNADCMRDECASFTCSVGGNSCVSTSNCTADFCANKTCSAGANACATDADCTADACANKACTEGLNACTDSSQCVLSPTDICVGSCSLGGNACVSSAACTLDKCQGTCSVGGNTCVNNTVCTQDTCQGLCTIGGNTCVNDSVCTEPQTDLCEGSCTIGLNSCVDNSVCTQPQTDVCEGACALSGGVCVPASVCPGPSVQTLLWRAPSAPGAATVWYDTLRSLVYDDFTTATTCVESDGSSTDTEDPTQPTMGEPELYYLIRIQNACPGSPGSLGSNWFGTRTGRDCP